MTPYEKLKSSKKTEIFLKKEMTFKQLDIFALEMSDNEATWQINPAKQKLFKQINEQEAAQDKPLRFSNSFLNWKRLRSFQPPQGTGLMQSKMREERDTLGRVGSGLAV